MRATEQSEKAIFNRCKRLWTLARLILATHALPTGFAPRTSGTLANQIRATLYPSDPVLPNEDYTASVKLGACKTVAGADFLR